MTRAAFQARAAAVNAADRVVPAALGAATAGCVAATLPFYPAGWPLGLAAAAGAAGALSPRLGLAFVLVTAFFPLANISLGLAILFAVLGAGWLALAWQDARAALLPVAGPLLAPLALLAILPLVAQLARGGLRRAIYAGSAVLAAALVAGFRHEELPFDGSAPPLGLGIAGSDRPSAVATALWEALAAHPVLLIETAVLGAAALALPHARGRGPWAAALFGAGLLAATALVAPQALFLPLAAAAWATAGLLALTSDELD